MNKELNSVPSAGTDVEISTTDDDTTSSQPIANTHVGSSVPVPAVRIRFYPKDTDETFDGSVIEETQFSYLVIPDDNLTGIARWNKKYCDVLR